VRIALGAGIRQIMGMILSGGIKMLVIGIVLGLAGSLASVRLLSGMLWQVSTFDPLSFISVSLLLFTAGVFASYWPARRAGRVDPLTVLREE
jgi:putative ABC transport system permease protein